MQLDSFLRRKREIEEAMISYRIISLYMYNIGIIIWKFIKKKEKIVTPSCPQSYLRRMHIYIHIYLYVLLATPRRPADRRPRRAYARKTACRGLHATGLYIYIRRYARYASSLKSPWPSLAVNRDATRRFASFRSGETRTTVVRRCKWSMYSVAAKMRLTVAGPRQNRKDT